MQISTSHQSGGGDTPVTPPTDEDNAIYSWDLTQSLVDSKTGKVISLFGATQDSNRLHLNTANDYALIDGGLLYVSGKRVEIEFGECTDGGFDTHGRLIRFGTSADATSFDHGLCWRSTGYWSVYAGSWKTVTNQLTDKVVINNSKVTLIFNSDDTLTAKIGDVVVHDNVSCTYRYIAIGASSQAYYNATIKSIKVYEV